MKRYVLASAMFALVATSRPALANDHDDCRQVAAALATCEQALTAGSPPPAASCPSPCQQAPSTFRICQHTKKGDRCNVHRFLKAE